MLEGAYSVGDYTAALFNANYQPADPTLAYQSGAGSDFAGPPLESQVSMTPTTGEYTQPWFPLFLLWRLQWQGTPWKNDDLTPNWTFTEGDGIQGSTATYRFEGSTSTSQPYVPIKIEGRSVITPHISRIGQSRVDQVVAQDPSVSPDMVSMSNGDEDSLSPIKLWDALSQPLYGFNNRLLTCLEGTFSVPNSGNSYAQAIQNRVGVVPTKRGTFQPVSHGQFYFQQLTVVDRFGQSLNICGSQNYSTLPLSMSDVYLTHPDKAVSSDSDLKYRCVQVPPSILQASRLNASWLDPSSGNPIQPGSGIDPVCGWILVNYLDQSMQVYDFDGTALGEILLGSQSGSPCGIWSKYPGSPPVKSQDVTNFITNMGQASFFPELLNAVTVSTDTNQVTPSIFSKYLAGLVGRPYALVKAMWSLELAQPIYSTHDTLAYGPGLTLDNYNFGLKLGSSNLSIDGLVGYYVNYDYTKLYSPLNCSFKSIKPPADNSYINLTVSYPNPAPVVTTMIMDPFLAVHGFTAILPATKLKIPESDVRLALQKIQVIIRTGPLLVTEPINTTPYIRIPKPSAGQWIWQSGAQTVPDPDKRVPVGTNPNSPKFIPVRIKPLDLKARFEAPPYTAIDGYLQSLRLSLVSFVISYNPATSDYTFQIDNPTGQVNCVIEVAGVIVYNKTITSVDVQTGKFSNPDGLDPTSSYTLTVSDQAGCTATLTVQSTGKVIPPGANPASPIIDSIRKPRDLGFTTRTSGIPSELNNRALVLRSSQAEVSSIKTSRNPS